MKILLVVFSCLAVVVAVRYIQTHEVALAERGQVRGASNLAGHPIYREYEFGQDESITDLGTQPIVLPTSLISETMRRDTLLHTALAVGSEERMIGLNRAVNEIPRKADLTPPCDTPLVETEQGGPGDA